jgi:DHA1 family bicyclomycin/chloramphenicol resistance-like MFS transporter
MIEHRRNEGWLFVTALVAVTVIGPLAIHISLPAMPAVQSAFGIGVAAAQLALSIALFTMACGTLVYGSMSDRYGRRPVLLVGIALFTLGAMICAAADDYATLIAGRVVQAAGAGCGMVLGRAIVRDVYGADRLVQMIAYLTMAYVLGPMLAPSIGGALTDAFGWRAIFIMSAAAGALILMLVWWAVAESHQERAASRGLGNLVRGYRRLLAIARFDAYVLHLGFASAAFYVHSTSASFLLIDVLGRPAAEYGLYFLAFPLGYVAGNFVAGRLARRVSVETMVLVGATVSLAAVSAMAVAIAAGGLTPLALFIPGGASTFGQGLSMPNSQSGAINVARDLTGTASGLVVFAQFMFGALFAQLGGALADATARPMLVIVVGASVLALACAVYPTLERRRPVPAE